MFKEIIDTCPACGEEELRPIRLGNDKDGWQLTGDFECDDCGSNFRPFNNSDELEQIGGDGLEPDVYPEDDLDSEPQEILDEKEELRHYRDEEILELNSK